LFTVDNFVIVMMLYMWMEIVCITVGNCLHHVKKLVGNYLHHDVIYVCFSIPSHTFSFLSFYNRNILM